MTFAYFEIYIECLNRNHVIHNYPVVKIVLPNKTRRLPGRHRLKMITFSGKIIRQINRKLYYKKYLNYGCPFCRN